MAYKIGTITLSAALSLTGSLSADIQASGPGEVFGSVSASGSLSLGTLSASWTALANGKETGSTKVTVTINGTTHEVDGIDTATVDCSGAITITIPCDICVEFLGQEGDNPFLAGVVDSPPYQKLRFFLLGNGDASVQISIGSASLGPTTFDSRGVEFTPNIDMELSCDGSAGLYFFHNSGEPTYQTCSSSGSLAATLATNLPPGAIDESHVAVSHSAVDTIVTSFDPFTEETITLPPDTGISTANTGGISVSTQNGGSAAGTVIYTAARSYSSPGTIRAMESGYPDTLILTNSLYAGDPSPTFTASSSFTRSYTQASGTTIATANPALGPGNGTADTHSKSEFTDWAITVSAASLTANGDEPLCRRVLLHGMTTGGLTITQDASATVEDWSSGTATGTGSGTPMISGGSLQIVTGSGGVGGASRAYSPAKSLASYRYLRVPLTGSGADNIPVVVTIGSYSWSTTTGADGVTVNRDLDLCAPTSAATSALNDNWDTRWPTPTTYPSPTSGPYDTASIAFGGIPASRTVTIGALSLVRVGEPTLTLLPTLYPSVFTPGTEFRDPSVDPEWPTLYDPEHVVTEDVTSQTYVRRFLLGNTDGRGVPEETDMTYTRIDATPTSYSWGYQTVQDLADAINLLVSGVPRWPGWSATVAHAAPSAFVPAYTGQPAPVDYYYNNASTLYAAYLYGGGALYSHADGWKFGFDIASGSISAQWLFDAVEACGLEGDIFNLGGSGDGLTVPTSIILRSAAQGLVFDSSRHPKSGISIDLRTGSGTGTPRSQGTSRTPDGWYHTSSLPFAKASITGTVYQTGRSSPSVSVGTLYTRHRHRASILGAQDIYYRPLAIDHPRQWLHIGVNAQVWTYHAATQTLAFQSGDHPVDHWLSLATDARRALLVGVGQTGTDEASVFTSRDGGKTMTGVLMSLSGKSFAVATDSERGFTLLLYEDPSDFTIYRSIARDTAALTWETAAQVQSSGSPITGQVLSLTSANPRGTGDLFLTVGAVDGSGAPTGYSSVYRSTNAGKDWTLVLS